MSKGLVWAILDIRIEKERLPYLLKFVLRLITKAETHPDLFNNFPDLRFKPHVQHAVSFIQNEVSAPTQICFLTFQEVDQTTRGRYANLQPQKIMSKKLIIVQ